MRLFPTLVKIQSRLKNQLKPKGKTMFYLNKTLKNELNTITNKLQYIKNKIHEIDIDYIDTKTDIEIINKTLEEHIKANNQVIIDAKKDFKELEQKTTNLQREIEILKKEKKLLLNGLNETRLAVNQIATILHEKGFIKLKEENKNERNNTKHKHSKQNISKHC